MHVIKVVLRQVASVTLSAVVMLVIMAAAFMGGMALLSVFTDPSEKAATTEVYAPETPPTETTTAPPPEDSPAPAPVVESVDPAPAPEPVAPAPESTVSQTSELPEGWLPPLNPGEPPRGDSGPSAPPAPPLVGEDD